MSSVNSKSFREVLSFDSMQPCDASITKLCFNSHAVSCQIRGLLLSYFSEVTCSLLRRLN